ncbi:MAG: rubrerythrin family protein [Candidatus Nealsonbacteria bacterium]|nr:rubrerythrin family protein [Candidatus Nealsonbacteria bacterium]
MDLSLKTRKKILNAQKNEITEYFIYSRLAEKTKDPRNRKTLKEIAEDEKSHYEFWKQFTGQEVGADRFNIWKYYLIARIFGLTFGVKLMEQGEEDAQVIYDEISMEVPEAGKIVEDEDKHEKRLLDMIDEESLHYTGSIVLGLNDALVELTGALAGFTLTLQKPDVIAVAGLVTGVAASFSMAASEYLSSRTEETEKEPLRSAFYTGLAYFFTVVVLILPFLILKNPYFSLILTLFGAVFIIGIFNFYISVAQDVSFKERFREMVLISLGVSLLTFLIGILIRNFLKIDI